MTLPEATRISSHSPELKSQDYAHLRETGLEVLRSIAAQTWTDHNLHDPGITILEALCYALTEAGLRAGMEVKDLVESGRVVAPPEFFTAAAVLPVAPVTVADFRKVLIDHPQVRNAWLSQISVVPRGRYDVLLEYADDALNAFSFIETINTAISQYRVEISLPHWDEPEASPLRTDVPLNNAVFDVPAWRPIEGSDAWFNRILLDYQSEAGPIESARLWVVARAVSPVADPPSEIPLILQEVSALVLTLGDNSNSDQSLLKRYQRERVIAASDAAAVVRRYLQDYRNLGEYFGQFRSARLQEIAFGATIEIATVASVEELLADIFFEVAEMISPSLRFSELETFDLSTLNYDLRLISGLADPRELPAVGTGVVIVAEIKGVIHFRIVDVDGNRIVDTGSTSLPEFASAIEELEKELDSLWTVKELSASKKEKIISSVIAIVGPAAGGDMFEGPMLDHGFLRDESKINQALPNRIYSSDILRIIFQQGSETWSDIEVRSDANGRSVKAVRNIRLSNYLDGRSITTNAKDCLRLVESNHHVPRLSPPKCVVFFIRDGVEVPYDRSRVEELFAGKLMSFQSDAPPGSEDLPVPAGESFPISDYYPVQNDLPRVYGVGEAGLPENASPARRAQAKQLKGYMQLFEQLIAGYLSQLGGINALFSADLQLQSTMLQQKLYRLPGIEDILKGFNASTMTWENFIADPENPYSRILDNDVESEDQFLDRRNRMLDHLLSRLGEDMDALASMTFRQAVQVPDSQTFPLAELLEAQQRRRRFAARQMIEAKSAFYYDLPSLQLRRLQSYGNVLWNNPLLARFEETSAGITWQLRTPEDQILFTQRTAAETNREAQRAAEISVALATQASHYFVVADGGQQRLELRTGSIAGGVATSAQSFPDVATAEAEIPALVQEVRQWWLDFAMTPLERRLYHLLAIQIRERKSLLQDLTKFFEILDDPNGTPQNEKIFRLWMEPAFSGDQLLESEGNFPGTSDAEAIERARTTIHEVLIHGVREENYSFEGSTPALGIALRNTASTILARAPGTFVDENAARSEIGRIAAHLWRQYNGGEGFFLIENHLLYSESGPALVIPAAGLDPYSFQLSFVLPSGYIQDFSTGERTEDLPDRFRDPEFRQFAERMIRISTPSHILPRIYWVDRSPAGAPLIETEPCLDLFESRFVSWLEAYFTDDETSAVLEPLRDDLVSTLNSIIQSSQSAP